MNVFVAGATGVIGRRLVPRLTEAGHGVVGATRSEARAAGLREAGAEAVVVDVFDAAGLAEAVKAAAPEAVIHELTDIPTQLDPKRFAEQFAGNDRVRTEGTRNLMAAAKAAGVRRVVAQSVAFAYAPEGPWVKSEEDRLYLDAPQPFGPTVQAVADLEDQVLGAEGIEGVVLRYGLFYGPDTAYAAGGQIAQMVKKRRFPVVGSGEGRASFIHIEDAAAATVAALERAGPGVYNIVDDEPAPVREWLPVYAEILGARKPRHVPAWLGRLVAGQYAVYLMTQIRGSSNEQAKRELEWTPDHPTWREGFKA
jgi:nucleoside-diphosphate-sugar epimerase